MPGWTFVCIPPAAATLPAAAGGGPLGLVVALVVVPLVSAVAGAQLRPDRRADAIDEGRR